jgi:hypothetical protein
MSASASTDGQTWTPSSLLVAGSSAILFALGSMHLLFTFVGPKLLPRDPQLQKRMGEVCMQLTKETTVWRAWIGFNASHSLSLMLFGTVYGYLAVKRSKVLFHDPFLLYLGLAYQLIYLGLARKYFFSRPFQGVLTAASMYTLGMLLDR